MAIDPQKVTRVTSIRNVALMFFRAMVGAYALNTFLHVALIILIGEQWLIVEFLNTFAQLLWLPTFILIPICLLMREWRLVAMMAPALIAFCLLWGALFLPNKPIEAQAGDIHIRALSYNLYAGNPLPIEYTQTILDTHANIVALQELNFPQAEILRNEFNDTYPYMAFHPGGTQGQGFMSRYPIIEDEYWRYEFLQQALGHQRVVLQIDDETQITVYNVHPTHPAMHGEIFNPEFRSLEIAELLERTTQEDNPVLILGDFNMPDFSEDYRAISSQFEDAFREAGFGFGWTFPVIPDFNSAFLRLDYIFYTEQFDVQSAVVNTGYTGSDHNSLYADMLILAGDS